LFELTHVAGLPELTYFYRNSPIFFTHMDNPRYGQDEKQRVHTGIVKTLADTAPGGNI
jgi:hypothetical protein